MGLVLSTLSYQRAQGPTGYVLFGRDAGTWLHTHEPLDPGTEDMLLLITAWTLLTVASALGLLALLAFDEWQVRARTPFRSVSVQPAADGTAVDASERPHAAGVLVAA